MPAALRGRLITLEGIDGAGKSTHLPWLAEFLAQGGRQVWVTREPGGPALGERPRRLLLAAPIGHGSRSFLRKAAGRCGCPASPVAPRSASGYASCCCASPWPMSPKPC